MSASTFRIAAVAAVLLASVSCEINVDPGDGDDADGFSLLIERRNAGGQRSFYTMSGDGTRFTPFTALPSDALSLIPAPDGKTIAYLRDATGGYVDLWVMDRDGANRRAILPGSYIVESAAWSPDGKKLVMSVSTDLRTDDLATINADGTGLTWLTSDPLPGVIFDRDPSWSRDGTRIAFSSNASGTRRLWIMNADGTGAQQVLPASFAGSEANPVWAPDTTNFIAVVAATAAGEGIAFVRADGTDFKHIPIPAGPNELVWLPDGRLVYVADATGDYDLWTVDRVSGATTQLTTRRDDDVKAAVLKNVAAFAWLGLAAPVTYQINRPIAVDLAIADVVTDGRQDVLVLSPILNEIRLMRGTPNGTLQAVGALFAESDVSALRSGLVTPDASPDLVGRGDSAAYLWRGRVDGPGVSIRVPANGELRDVAVADLDGSGRADLISLVENNGQPFHIRTHTVSANDNVVLAVDVATTRTAGRSLCAGDVNGDGRLDVVILAGGTTLSAFVAEGRGDLGVNGPVPAGTALSSDLQAAASCADFNNDGKDDLALFSFGAAQSVGVHKFGTTAFGAAARVSAAASAVAIADVDRDGDLDVIMAASNAASILVAKNRGGGTFDTPLAYAIAGVPIALAVADLNGDHWPDVAAVDVNGALVVLLSLGRTGM